MEMKVKLTRGILHEKEHYDAGQVLELSAVEAHKLLGMGKAVPYAEEVVVENRAVALESSDEPVLQKRTYKKKVAE
jgi:hypothetical protein